MPTVSLLVTVYNREKYLSETIHSLLKSEFRDFELLIVDDKSDDRSFEIAREFAKSDSRISVHRNEKNLGDYGNRMKIAGLATGTFLKYVDSDDLLYPHALQVMVDAMERFPQVVLGLSHSMPEDDQPYPWMLTPEQSYRKQFLGRGCLNCGPTGAIIRREAFESVGGFRREWGVLSDTELWLRLAARFPIVLLPPALAWWRRHEGQEFTVRNAADVYLEKGHDLDLLALQSDQCPLSATDRIRAIEMQRQRYARRLLSMALVRRQLVTAVRLYRKSHLTISDLFRGLYR
jgi:glycosyltransferase involved in cell wall biosynthesis